MTQPNPSVDAEGLADLGICESLVLALTERKIISDKEARDLLNDVVTTHTNMAAASTSPEKHLAVVDIIRRILAGKNGIPRPV